MLEIKGKQIFITGGAGFIGTQLITKLADKNKIVIYDNLLRNSIIKTNLLNHPNVRLIEGDILDFNKLKDSIKASNIVIHLAAIAGVSATLESPVTTMTVNIIGTYNILKAAHLINNLERLIITSTSEVFGTYAYKVEETQETAQGYVGEARWRYAVSKLAVEHFSRSYFDEFKMPTVNIRPFNVYGPGQVGEGAIHNFIIKAINNEDLIVHGDGSQIRAWCYIDDFIDGFLMCLDNPNAIGNVFNIGNPRSTITIYNLAKLIIQIAKSESKIVFKPIDYTDIEIRIPSIEKAKKVLKFEPKVELEEGIEKTIEWYRKNR